MALRLMRVVYAIEFLMALVATLEVWREVGGQGHLDLIPWFTKLFLAIGLAAALVKVTAASVEPHPGRTALWALVVFLFLVTGGLVTYYYHLNEPLDEEESTTLTAGWMELDYPDTANHLLYAGQPCC